MFFWNRKKVEKKTTPEPENTQENSRTRRYYTNYYSYSSVRRRDSLRSKRQRKDEIGEYKLEVGLTHLPKCFYRLSNLLLKGSSGFLQIDHLLVSPYGIFLLEVINLSGLITGEEEDSKWHQAMTWRVKSFPNPLLENQVRAQALREQGRIEADIPIFSYVTFNRRCNLKVFSGVVFYDIDIIASIVKLMQNLPVLLSEERMQEILERIEKVNIKDQGLRNEYAARLRREVRDYRPKYGDIRCKVCHKPVTERMARYCLNRPEKFAWKIYCEKHQKEMTKVIRRDPRRDEQDNRAEEGR